MTSSRRHRRLALFVALACIAVLGIPVFISRLGIDNLDLTSAPIPGAAPRYLLPTRPPRPPGWQPPVWPEASSTAPLPEFAVTSWTFPNTDEALAFYAGAPALSRVRFSIVGLHETRVFASDCSAALSALCPDPHIRRALLNLGSSPDAVLAPVLLHRICVDRTPVWVVAVAWEYAIPSAPVSLAHYQVIILDPVSGQRLAFTACA